MVGLHSNLISHDEKGFQNFQLEKTVIGIFTFTIIRRCHNSHNNEVPVEIKS